MGETGGRFFSMWYGVYDVRDRSLSYTNAGHPPALLFKGDEVTSLGATGTMVGVSPDSEYFVQRICVPPAARLYLYTDGAYEVTTPKGEMLQLEDLRSIITSASHIHGPRTAEILRLIRQAHGKMDLQDDLSLLEVTFD